MIEVDLTLYSDSVRLDSGEFVLAGAGSISPFDELETADDDEAGLVAWRAYRAAFAAEPVP